MEPLVSVVVVTYQHAAYIEECLLGILMQRTTFPVEILVGEDESTDGTRAICERYAKEHPDRIRLFLRSRKDVLHIRGQATGRANFMALLASAKGRYIAWCEGDDFWTDPLKLQKQVDLLEDDPTAAGSYHHTRVVDKDSKELQMVWREELKERLDLDEVVAPLAAFHSSSFVFRNFPFLKTMPAFFHKIAAGDLGMFALIAGEGELRRVEGVMSAYRKHTGGITSEAIHLGTRFHIERMRLWMYLDRHFPGRIRDATSRVCGWHWNKIMEHTSGRERLNALWELFRAVPMWFVVRPRIALHFLWSVLPR